MIGYDFTEVHNSMEMLSRLGFIPYAYIKLLIVINCRLICGSEGGRNQSYFGIRSTNTQLC